MTKFSYFLGSEQWQPEDLIKHAEIAREAGFDMLTISEHFHPWVDDYSASNFTWTTLGALANKLPELDLGTGVTTPLWRIHPGVIAQAAATVDRLSPSTFHLGVGTGENINEGPLGYNFPKYEERKNRLIEALTIIRRLLDGEKLDFNGEYYTTEKAKLYSPPQGNIPIWLAAGGPKSAQVAAEYADGLMISVKDPKDSYERVIDPAKQKSKELKRENLEPIVQGLIKSNNTNFKGVGQPLRVALTGSKFGPGIYDIIISLGKEEVEKRLSNKTIS